MGTYTFINIIGEEYQSRGGSYSNEAECIAICRLIQKMKKFPGWDSPNKLRIITFYHGQVILIQRCLAQGGFGNVLVATVDSSQVTLSLYNTHTSNTLNLLIACSYRAFPGLRSGLCHCFFREIFNNEERRSGCSRVLVR